ncbi:MAG: MobQ family relaxase [Chloroflexota bacterium]
MVNATYRISLIGRGARRSSVGMASYQSGKTLRVRSVVAAASYRSGEPLHDRNQSLTYDYSDREDVMYNAILAPLLYPDWVHNREELWNRVEERETRKDSQLARSIVVALPRELSIDDNIALLREHVQEQFVSQGMIADIAVHLKDASDGLPQPHGHILLSLREIDDNGEWSPRKNREWNHPSLAEQWRTTWEQTQNAYLEAAESDARVCMASYERQGINRVPTLHMGQRAWDLEQDGLRTRIGNINRDIAEVNEIRAVMDTITPLAAITERDWQQTQLVPPDEIARLEHDLLEPPEQEMERGIEDG